MAPPATGTRTLAMCHLQLGVGRQFDDAGALPARTHRWIESRWARKEAGASRRHLFSSPGHACLPSGAM